VSSEQQLIMTLLKLVAYRIVTSTSVVEWLFSDEFLSHTNNNNNNNNNITQSPMTQLYFWELLIRLVDKTLLTTQLLKSKLHELSNSTTTSKQQNTLDIEAIKEAYNVARKEQDTLIELVFSRLVQILQANRHLPEHNFWYYMTYGHLKAFGRRYYKQLAHLLPTLDVHFANVDTRFRDIFTQISFLATNFY
jgi:hypothetical protein